MDANLISLACTSGIICFLLVVLTIRRQFCPSNLPHGPIGLPIIGNLLQVPKKRAWETFSKWGQVYGDVLLIMMARRPVIILNSYEAANDLFNKRSSVFSDRPVRAMAELCGYDRALAFLSLGEHFRKTRASFNRVLNAQAVQEHRCMQEFETHRFLKGLLQEPHTLHTHIRCLSASIMIRFTLGRRVSYDDPILTLSERVTMNAVLILTPGVFLIEMVPFFKRVPLWMMPPKYRSIISEWRHDLRHLMDEAHSRVLEDIAAGTSAKSYASETLAYLGSALRPEDEDIVKYGSISLYGGAVDTFVSVLTSFFLAMILNPDAQQKAQAEIDRVIGTGRLPSISDRPSLPYVDALLTEVLRWSPVAPLTTRYLTQTQEYNGFLLPSGTTVIANIWAMTRNEDSFPAPHEFRPERFLEQQPTADAGDVHRLIFGFGRRVCPGSHFANQGLWTVISNVLATITVSAPVDPDGREIMPEVDFRVGVVCQPVPFDYHLEPRACSANILMAESSEH